MNDSYSLKSILLMAANPKGTSSLRLQEEEREIEEPNHSSQASESANDFATVLQSLDEDKVQKHLTSNSHVVLAAFGSRWAVNECIPKFQLGALE